MKPTAEQIKTIALIVDGEAWKAIEDGRDALPGSLWGFRRDIAMEKAMAIAALSVQPAAAVVGEPTGYLFEMHYGNGRWSGTMFAESINIPAEDVRNVRPLYAAPPAPDDDGWQDIETAPKEGFFLAWSPDHPELVMTWKAEIFHQARTPGTPRHLSANHFTLWMPIPLPGGQNG